MAYTNYPSTGQQPEQMPKNNGSKDGNRKLIYGILIALLLLTWGYILWDHSQSKQQLVGMQQQVATSDSSKSAIQVEYESALSRMDSLTGSNVQLTGTLAQQKDQIDQLKNQIEDIRKKDHGDLTRAKGLIDELNSKINNLYAQIAQLKQENATLTANNQTLSNQRDTLTVQNSRISDSLSATNAEKNRIVDEASTLHVSNINIEAISGKGKETTKAKRASLLRVSFTVDANRIASSGPKDLYIIVTAPDGRVVSIPAQGSGTFQTRTDGRKVYTNMQSINFTQGQRENISFDWNPDARYQAGDYKIEIYNNGYKIGEGIKSLKKSGFLGL